MFGSTPSDNEASDARVVTTLNEHTGREIECVRRRAWHRRRGRCPTTAGNIRTLDPDSHGRAGLEESNRRIHRSRRTVGIKTEVVGSSPADCVGVFVLSDGLGTPAQVAGSLVQSPLRVAISRVSLGRVVGKASRITGGVKLEIAYRGSAAQRDRERLDRAIEILVIDRVFVMPYTADGTDNLVGDKSAPIHAGLWFDGLNGGAGPGGNGRHRGHGGASDRERETRCAANVKSGVRRVITHVALAGVSLTPGVLVRGDVLDLGVIGRTRIHGWVQIVRLDRKAV